MYEEILFLHVILLGFYYYYYRVKRGKSIGSD